MTGSLGRYSRSPWCRNLSLTRLLVLAGQIREATKVSGKDDANCELSTDRDSRLNENFLALSVLRAMALEMQGRNSESDRALPTGVSRETLLDYEQNLLRYGGNLEMATEVVDRWVKRSPRSRIARQRQGEIAYRSKQYPVAVEAFEIAADQAVTTDDDEFGTDSVRRMISRLQSGLALEQVGRTDAAAGAYRAALDPAIEWPHETRAAALTRIAALAAARGDRGEAIGLLQKALKEAQKSSAST